MAASGKVNDVRKFVENGENKLEVELDDGTVFTYTYTDQPDLVQQAGNDSLPEEQKAAVMHGVTRQLNSYASLDDLDADDFKGTYTLDYKSPDKVFFKKT